MDFEKEQDFILLKFRLSSIIDEKDVERIARYHHLTPTEMQEISTNGVTHLWKILSKKSPPFDSKNTTRLLLAMKNLEITKGETLILNYIESQSKNSSFFNDNTKMVHPESDSVFKSSYFMNMNPVVKPWNQEPYTKSSKEEVVIVKESKPKVSKWENIIEKILYDLETTANYENMIRISNTLGIVPPATMIYSKQQILESIRSQFNMATDQLAFLTLFHSILMGIDQLNWISDSFVHILFLPKDLPTDQPNEPVTWDSILVTMSDLIKETDVKKLALILQRSDSIDRAKDLTNFMKKDFIESLDENFKKCNTTEEKRAFLLCLWSAFDVLKQRDIAEIVANVII
jgi:hypothetical protein